MSEIKMGVKCAQTFLFQLKDVLHNLQTPNGRITNPTIKCVTIIQPRCNKGSDLDVDDVISVHCVICTIINMLQCSESSSLFQWNYCDMFSMFSSSTVIR